MLIVGYKRKFKNIKSISTDVFTINFNLKYTESGALRINDEESSYFDVGDYRILIDKIFEEFDDNMLKIYDNGIYILSICKYIVDKLPNLYSIIYETDGMVDTYYKKDIIEDYIKTTKLQIK